MPYDERFSAGANSAVDILEILIDTGCVEARFDATQGLAVTFDREETLKAFEAVLEPGAGLRHLCVKAGMLAIALQKEHEKSLVNRKIRRDPFTQKRFNAQIGALLQSCIGIAAVAKGQMESEDVDFPQQGDN